LCQAAHRPYTDHIQTIHRPYTYTIHRPYTDHTQTIHRPFTDHSQTIHRPYIDHTQTIHRPYTDHTQTIHRPYTDHTQTIHRPYTDHTDHIRPGQHRARADFKTFHMALTSTPSTAAAAAAGPQATACPHDHCKARGCAQPIARNQGSVLDARHYPQRSAVIGDDLCNVCTFVSGWVC